MAEHPHSPNYDFVIDTALELAGRDGIILDFGCGMGKLLQLTHERGFVDRFSGVDTFEGHYEEWAQSVPEAVRNRVSRIENGRIPHEDGRFDVVVSNQVFEHIADPPPSLDEISRVLKPGGAFLALFPTGDVWFEGHAGLYFVHWLGGYPKLQRQYLRACRGLGLGYGHSGLDGGTWADLTTQTLQTACFNHSIQDVRHWWRQKIGAPATSLAADYMRYRIARHPRFKALSAIAESAAAAPLLEFVCHRRAGRVLLARKPGTIEPADS